MNKIHHPMPMLIAAAFVLLPTRNAGAQVQTEVVRPGRAQGHFSAWALGLSSRNLAGDSVLIRATSVAGGVPQPWHETLFDAASDFHPDYSTGALTQHWAANLPTPEFGGISTGGDLMPVVDASGRLQMAAMNSNRWYALTIAVAPDAQGLPGSMIAVRRGGDPTWNAAGDIISYYAVGSTEIHSELVDKVYLESSSEQLHLDAIEGGNGEIANLDYGMGVISADPEGYEGLITFPVRNKFYFTLTQAWIDSLGPNPSLQLDQAPPNASTVYVMTWSMSPVPHWSEPEIAFSHDELFPKAAFPRVSISTVEIDAISVDQGSGGPWARLVVFSLTPDSDLAAPDPVQGFDQILVYQRLTSNGQPITQTQALQTDPAHPPSTTLSSRLGLVGRDFQNEIEPDDVTSTCGIDPREGYAVNSVLGRATDQPEQGEGALGLSAFRADPPGSDSDLVTFQITGLELEGWNQAACVQLYWESPVNAQPSWSNPLGDPVWVDPSAVQRNTIEMTAPLWHPSVPPTPLRVSARYFGYDPDQGGWVLMRQSWVITLGT